MKLVARWRALEKQVASVGLAPRIAYVPATAKAYSGTRPADPKPAQLAPYLPAGYRSFVAEVGYPAIDLGRGARWAMLPPPAMCQVTGAMGHPGQKFELTRKQRAADTYRWPFAFFAGFDLADVNGWSFDAEGAWLVEDSLPLECVGTFEDWLSTEIAACSKAISSKAKVAALVAELCEDDDDNVAAISLASF